MRVCLVPGSYDPITRGHVDIILRAAKLFDKTIVAILRNPDKRGWLTWDQRETLVRASLKDYPEVTVVQFEGLLVNCAREHGACAVVRGVRSAADFEYESPMAVMNRELSGADGLETVFLAADPALAHLSSGMARQLAAFGGTLDSVVPAGALGLLKGFIKGIH